MPAELDERAKAASEDVAKLESEREQLAAEADKSLKAAGEAVSALVKAKEATAGARDEEKKQVDAALASAKQAVAKAQEEIKQAEAQHAERRQTAELLAKAAEAAKQASARLADDKELAQAAAQITKRSQDFAQDVAAAEKLVVQRKAEAQQAADKLATAEKKVAELAAKGAAAKQQLATLEKWLADGAAKRDSARSALRSLDRRLTATRQLADFGALAASESEAQAAQLETARVALGEAFARRFAVATLKPLSPEQLAWSMLQATGQLETQRVAAAAEVAKKNPPKDGEPAEAASARETEIEQLARTKLQGAVSAFVNLFAAAPGTPQQDFSATVDQALFFSNGALVRGWLNPSGTNLMARCTQLEDPQAIAEELYLSILGRLPDEAEAAEVTSYLAAQSDSKPAALQEIAWALLTSVEFRFNH
jgi:hypothetical protein